MSTKKLTIGSDSYDYPITGSGNYGEEATAWSSAVTEVLKQVSGPGDIPTTLTALVGIDNLDGTSTGFVTGLLFDTSFVQRIEVKGFITRTFTVLSGKSDQVESFVSEGAYNGSEFNITVEFSGDDNDVELFTVGGQYKFTSVNDVDTETIAIKFEAKVIADLDAL